MSLGPELPTLPPPLTRAQWAERRLQRRALCEAAAVDPALLGACLGAWALPAAALRRVWKDLALGEEAGGLCAWALEADTPPGEGGSRAEIDWDLEALGRPAPRPYDASEGRVAALYLLCRLGEELDLRERRAPREWPWAADPRDASAAEVWTALLQDRPDLEAGLAFRRLWGGRVRAAFKGVGSLLGLPEPVASARADEAVDQLDLLAAGAHRELATRVIETGGEPIASLEVHLDAAGRARVQACIAGRSAWSELAGCLGPAPPGLATGADLVLLQRLVCALSEGRIRPHPLGLPGWGLVRANRSRMRGRLRVVLGESVSALAAPLRRLPALYARTGAAVGRFAWAWAWREARRGFAFDLRTMLPADCQVSPPRAPPLPPLGEGEEPALLAFLLLVLGRGCWAELLRWIPGDGGRDLSRTFYRCLELLPDRLADPGATEPRHRRYQRLREELDDGGLDERMPALCALAARVAAVPNGRGLREGIALALAEAWPTDGPPLPQHHLSPFQAACQEFLAGDLGERGRP